MTEESFAITLVHAPSIKERESELAKKYQGKRIVKNANDVQSGDVLLQTDKQTDALNWIASNVILLSDNRAPIVRKLTVEEAISS